MDLGLSQKKGKILIEDFEEVFRRALDQLGKEYLKLFKIALLQGLKNFKAPDCSFLCVLLTKKHLLCLFNGENQGLIMLKKKDSSLKLKPLNQSQPQIHSQTSHPDSLKIGLQTAYFEGDD